MASSPRSSRRSSHPNPPERPFRRPPRPSVGTGESDRQNLNPGAGSADTPPLEHGEVMTQMEKNVDDLLRKAVDHRASDIHLKVGSAPIVRIDGELRRLDGFDPLRP